MRKSHILAIKVIITLFLLASGVLGVLYWSHRRSMAQTESLINKVLDNPSYVLRDDEEDKFRYYLEESNIPYTRQVALVKAAFRRISEDDARSRIMLNTIAERWARDGSFSMLPFAVNEAIFASSYKRKEDNKDICIGRIVGIVGATWRLESYLNVEFIMLSVDDDDAIIYTCAACHPDNLFVHHSACLTMLKRRDIGYPPKIILLAKIADSQQGKKWFEGEESLLQHLESMKDERIQMQVRRIREQIDAGNLGNLGTQY